MNIATLIRTSVASLVLVIASLMPVAAQQLSASAITGPVPGSTLTSASTTFTWNAASGGTVRYGLNIGTTPGGANLFNGYPLPTGTSYTVKLPAKGEQIYVRLWTVFNKTTFLYNDYTYTEFTRLPSTLTSPVPGSVLTSASITFTWNAGPTGTTGYGLNVGTTPGGADLVNVYPLSGTSYTINLPTKGATIYVRLWTVFNGADFFYNDYTYTEYGSVVSYQVNLSWTAPVNSSNLPVCTAQLIAANTPCWDSVVGYNVYRELSSQSGAYKLLNAVPVTGTAYVDSGVQSGQTYNYIAESVDASGVTSAPSNTAVVVVP